MFITFQYINKYVFELIKETMYTYYILKFSF